MTSQAAKPLVLKRSDAVRMAYEAQFRPSGSGLKDAAAAVAKTLSRIGYVQIDTISVVERAHHHTFWSRDRSYRPDTLPLLEAEPRRAFEYWAHAAAYLPMEDYRYCLPRMRRVEETGHEWFPTDERVVASVLETIRAEGPKKSSDFRGDGPRGPWWDWKPAKAALEYLFMSGTLLVASRPGFQKLYDLAERVLPAGIDASFPSDEEMGDYYARRAALALGVFTEADVAYMRKDGTAGIRAALDRAVESGSLLEARVVGDEKRRYWVSAAALSTPSRPPRAMAARPVRILSPFDNYLIDRKRAFRMLGIEYSLECYVPLAKRRFGYFALPVVARGASVGLIDCKADRKAGSLTVNRAEFIFRHKRASVKTDGTRVYGIGDLGRAESDGAAPEGFTSAFAEELAAYAEFNGCHSVSTQ